MSKQDFLPKDDTGKAALFLHVRANLPSHFPALGIVAGTPQVVTQATDALAFEQMLLLQQTLTAAGKEATNAKNRLRDGDPLAPDGIVAIPIPDVSLTPQIVVTPGVVPRFRAFVRWLKALPAYADAIGLALRVVGDEATPADPALMRPVLPLTLAGGRVEIAWRWEGLAGQVDALEIQVDRGAGVFTLLTIDTRPGYVDTEPLPTPPAKWRYQAIFRKDDQRVGQWSDVAEINAG